MLNAFFAKRKRKIEVEKMDSRKEEEEEVKSRKDVLIFRKGLIKDND